MATDKRRERREAARERRRANEVIRETSRLKMKTLAAEAVENAREALSERRSDPSGPPPETNYKDQLKQFYNDGSMVTLGVVGLLAAAGWWNQRSGGANYGSAARHAGSVARHAGSASTYSQFTSRTMKSLIAQGYAPEDAMRESASRWRAKTGR